MKSKKSKTPKSVAGAEAVASRKAAKKGARKPNVKTLKPAVEALEQAVGTASKAIQDATKQSKGATVLAMIARDTGATIDQLMEATGWQAHSVRGFLSTASKKKGLKIESAKVAGAGRVYQIAS